MADKNGANTSQQQPNLIGRGAGIVPWRPGQSGNPSGRPKVLVELERMIREEFAGEKSLDLLRRLYRLAMDPEQDGRVCVAAAREFFDRVVGKPKQPVEVTEKLDGLTTEQLRERAARLLRDTGVVS